MDMKLLGIESREIVAIIELSIQELEYIEKALSLADIAFDGKDEKEANSVNYLTKTFFPAITALIKKIKEE